MDRESDTDMDGSVEAREVIVTFASTEPSALMSKPWKMMSRYLVGFDITSNHYQLSEI